MNGWILLHKKIWDNPLFRKHPYALSVWIWLLTHADENGVVTCGRNQIAKETGVNASTVQYWLVRFLHESYQLAIIKTNNRFSEYQICKWAEYQRKTISTSAEILSETYQQPITNKELKNKRNKEINTISNETAVAVSDPKELEYLELWKGTLGSNIRKDIPGNVKAAERLDKLLTREGLLELLKKARAIRSNQYTGVRGSMSTSNYKQVEKNIEFIEAEGARLLDKKQINRVLTREDI